jgi:cell division protein FtsB
LLTIDKEKLLYSYENNLKENLADANDRYKKIAREAAQLENEIAKLKEEVMKTLLGESSFSQDLLSEMLRNKEAELRILAQKQEASR